MATVSIVELVVRNAMQSDAFLVAAACCGGALAYYVAEPFFPKMDEPGAGVEHHHHHYGKVGKTGGRAAWGAMAPGCGARTVLLAAWCHDRFLGVVLPRGPPGRGGSSKYRYWTNAERLCCGVGVAASRGVLVAGAARCLSVSG